jgi:hypothetical protein
MGSNPFKSLQAKEYHYLHEFFFLGVAVLLINLKVINNNHFSIPNISLILEIVEI